MIMAYFIGFSLICLWKYFNFGYDGLDLAIFNQVFYNSAQGDLFQFTIHPNSYLGDHLDLIIILLLPFYYLFQHPISLLVLQSLILALCAWPLFLIAKKILSVPWSLFIAFCWLLNPFVQNINLFEFHTLTCAIFLLFWAFYYYQKNNFFAFLTFCVLALLVREDVALVVFMFAVIALFEKKAKKWIIWPALISAVWFTLALKIIDYFTPAGNYKFLYYYSWLGNNFTEMAINSFLHPLKVIKHSLTANNILFTAIIFMPFGFINLVKPKYLLLCLPIYLQIVLGYQGNSVLALKLHYGSLFLPALFISLIFSLSLLNKPNRQKKIANHLQKNPGLVFIILLIAVIYSSLTLGPLLGLAKTPPATEIIKLKNKFLQSVQPTASLIASYEFLTNLSSREKIYGLNYVFIGKKQFTDINYQPPADTQAMLVDFDDLLTFGIQFPNSQQWRQIYHLGDNNLRRIIKEFSFKATKVADSLVLFERSQGQGINLYQTADQFNEIQNIKNINFGNGLKFVGWDLNSVDKNPAYKLLPISLYFKTDKKLTENYQLKLTLKNKNGQIVHSKLYALCYGLYPTSDWQPNEIVKSNYWFLLPQEYNINDQQIELELLNFKGYLTLDRLRSIELKITKEDIIEPKIYLTN